ncbi:MarR family transcriptional regulator [Streptomyces sp. N2-109]|uniref:MarR family transcriptional regulator n=1 Tax=Streptomyces gossypii TaxID=2883101 RepID=A0ABT2JMI3_9ACTN|nr:MarR family transcriptional regulator [Streptomyces gossypii]MCT2589093.1 MarR family transcriptional regulator [Streptomyces gossypii]
MSKPIGYWLKHLHGLLEKQFDVTLADLGLGRRDWQVLHSLDGGPRTRDDLRQALAPFWAEGEVDLEEVLEGDEGLRARGWVDFDGGAGEALTLTGSGRAAHAEAEVRIGRMRAAVTAGLSAEQYGETVRVLSVMAANVEADLMEGRDAV